MFLIQNKLFPVCRGCRRFFYPRNGLLWEAYDLLPRAFSPDTPLIPNPNSTNRGVWHSSNHKIAFTLFSTSSQESSLMFAPSSRNSCSYQTCNDPRLSTPPIAKHQSLSGWRSPQWPLLFARYVLSFWVCNPELTAFIPNIRLISARNSAQASRQACNIAPSFSSRSSLYRGRLRHLCIKGNKYAVPKSPSLKTLLFVLMASAFRWDENREIARKRCRVSRWWGYFMVQVWKTWKVCGDIWGQGGRFSESGRNWGSKNMGWVSSSEEPPRSLLAGCETKTFNCSKGQWTYHPSSVLKSLFFSNVYIPPRSRIISSTAWRCILHAAWLPI